MSNRDAYIAKMKTQLDELNAKIGEVEERGRLAKTEALAAYKQEMTKLRARSKEAESKLEELKASGEESWDSMVASMEKTRDAFVHSFHYFKAQF